MLDLIAQFLIVDCIRNFGLRTTAAIRIELSEDKAFVLGILCSCHCPSEYQRTHRLFMHNALSALFAIVSGSDIFQSLARKVAPF